MSGEHHRTRWTREEVDLLETYWDGSWATTKALAKILGRTTDAVAQRHYEISWGQVDLDALPTEKDLPGPGQDRVRVTVRRTEITYEVDPERICPDCFTLRSTNGTCWC